MRSTAIPVILLFSISIRAFPFQSTQLAENNLSHSCPNITENTTSFEEKELVDSGEKTVTSVGEDPRTSYAPSKGLSEAGGWSTPPPSGAAVEAAPTQPEATTEVDYDEVTEWSHDDEPLWWHKFLTYWNLTLNHTVYLFHFYPNFQYNPNYG